MMILLSECGLAGVGMYWVIIEILHQQECGSITQEAYQNYIKFYCHFQNQGEHLLNKIEQVLISSKLLYIKNNRVSSERVLRNKKHREEISEKRSFAGKKSAEMRTKSTSVEQTLNKTQQGKERKGKEIKEKDIEDILSDLNLVLNSSYKLTSLKTKELIQARLNEGHTVADFKTVHRKMAKAWGLDNKMRQYLRPITLYSNKFESYLNRPEDIKQLTPQQQNNLKGLVELNKEIENDKRSLQ